MQLANLGCGSVRPGAPWVNVDLLHDQLAPGTPERRQLDSESNYVNADVFGPLPFADETFDGVLASHLLEHADAPQGLRILQEVHRVLKPGGIVLVSVPDASYFRKVYLEDRNENWPRLFGVTDPKNTIATWFEAALWFDQHRAIFTEDALWAYLVRAGFRVVNPSQPEILDAMREQLNRIEFSCVLCGIK